MQGLWMRQRKPQSSMTSFTLTILIERELLLKFHERLTRILRSSFTLVVAQRSKGLKLQLKHWNILILESLYWLVDLCQAGPGGKSCFEKYSSRVWHEFNINWI